MAELDKIQREVITTLDDMEEPATQKKIRERVGCPKSTLSNKLRKLEDSEYVVDKSGTFDNSKKYVLNEDVDVKTNYRFETFRDTQLTLYGLQLTVFAVLVVSMISVLNITRSLAYIMYGSFLLGLLPPALLHLIEKWKTDDLYRIEVDKPD